MEIKINKEIVHFEKEEGDPEIPVNEETRELLCVGNDSKHSRHSSYVIW